MAYPNTDEQSLKNRFSQPFSTRGRLTLFGLLSLSLLLLLSIYYFPEKRGVIQSNQPTGIEKLAADWVQDNVSSSDSVFSPPAIQEILGFENAVAWVGTGAEIPLIQSAEIDYVLLPSGILQNLWTTSASTTLHYDRADILETANDPTGKIIIWQRRDNSNAILRSAFVPDRFRILGVDPGQTIFYSAETKPRTISATLYLQKIASAHPLDNIILTQRLSTATGQIVLEESVPYQSEKPLAALRPGEKFAIPLGMSLPTDLAIGAYKLDVSFADSANGEPNEIIESGHVARLDRLLLNYYAISPNTSTGQIAPPPSTFSPVRFSDNISLLSYDTSINNEMQLIDVNLYWQASSPPSENYTVFVQIWDEDDNLIASHDSQPDKGRYPTRALGIGEAFIIDQHQLNVPTALDGRPYKLILGLYLLETGERLPILSPTGESIGDMLDLPALTRP